MAFRFLLDEHYPSWFAQTLRDDGLDVESVIARADLRGLPDQHILRIAADEHRILVTEDARTMPAAMMIVSDFMGVIYCPSSRFGRNRTALERLRQALLALVQQAPESMHHPGFVWWLDPPT